MRQKQERERKGKVCVGRGVGDVGRKEKSTEMRWGGKREETGPEGGDGGCILWPNAVRIQAAFFVV